MKRLPWWSVAALAACVLPVAGPVASAQPQAGPVPVYAVTVVKRFPHDPAAFTQGLVVDGDALLEGTGLTGRSDLRRVDLNTGRVLKRRALPSDVFGEGVTLLNGRVYQLTWQSKTGYVYDRATFALLRTFRYDTEGWGLTHDGRSLIMSDGSSTLTYLNPGTFRVERRVNVTADGKPVTNLNELEYVGGDILANVWMTDRIARIEPKTGRVTAWYDVSALSAGIPNRTPDDVPNGIAYDARTERLFVTGKRWPLLFEVKLGAER